MTNKRCIYCSPDKPINGTFNTREHIIPQSFGAFQNNFVFNGEAVCDQCNQFFGDNLELIFARGSVEAIRRLEYKVKSLDEGVRELRKDRVRLSLSTGDRFDGLVVEFGHEDDELVVLLVPQVGFAQQHSGDLVFVTERELEDPSWSLPKNVKTDEWRLLIYNSDQTKSRLVRLLKSRGLKEGPVSKEDILPIQPGEESWVSVRAAVDKIIFRCVAKISFNYLAYTAGIHFATTRDFNQIREYIRYGTDPGYQPVKISQRPILAYDTHRYTQANGHLVTVNWSPNNLHIVGQVRLFNSTGYVIYLSHRFRGIWRHIASGHHFNLHTKRIERLVPYPKQLL